MSEYDCSDQPVSVVSVVGVVVVVNLFTCSTAQIYVIVTKNSKYMLFSILIADHQEIKSTSVFCFVRRHTKTVHLTFNVRNIGMITDILAAK